MDPAQLRDPAEAQRLTVFYHAGCPDGITGAWALYAALPEEIRARLAALGGLFAEGGPPADPLEQRARAGAVFHGLAHADPPPPQELVAGRHVVYVDITPTPAAAAFVAGAARTLALLDHHRSGKATAAALAATCKIPFTNAYTEELSGAQIAWDWAHASPRPQLVDYVGDRDLYAFRLPGSRAANKALYVEGHTRGFAPLSDLHRREGGRISGELVARGGAYLRYEDQLVARLASSARLGTMAALPPGEAEPREYCVKVVNTPVLQSEVGEAVMERAPPEVHFAVMWVYNPDRDEIWASARTTRPDVDLSAIAPYVVGGKAVDGRTGGGHARAAGFAVAGDRISAAVRFAAAPSARR